MFYFIMFILLVSFILTVYCQVKGNEHPVLCHKIKFVVAGLILLDIIMTILC